MRGRKLEALEALAEFIPPSVREQIVSRVLDLVGHDPASLAETAGLEELSECDPVSLVTRAASLPAARFALLLSLGLAIPSDARGWIRHVMAAEVLQPVQRACAELGIMPPVNLDEVTSRLSPLARDVLAYLCARKHATLQEICDACGTDDHAALLAALRDEINGAACAADSAGAGPAPDGRAGKTSNTQHLVKFYRSRFDPDSGRRVLFSWWFTAPGSDGSTAPVSDGPGRISPVEGRAGGRSTWS